MRPDPITFTTPKKEVSLEALEKEVEGIHAQLILLGLAESSLSFTELL